MLSVASVKSAGGAANYFAKDDYYVGEHASEVSAWGGAGAAELGLAGEVDKAAFEATLNGKLPDGTQIGDPDKRLSGVDLTFSMPKSASVLAYVGGDERLLKANMNAVKATMQWVEKNFAEGRVYQNNEKGDAVRTENLTYAIFQHDTSRALDPQAHLHVIVANLTKVNGVWKALHNGELWKNNSIIGSVYHAQLRQNVEKLGYQTQLTGKHGQFEIAGVPKDVLQDFSQRRTAILAKAAELGRGTNETEALREITRRTRDDKINLEDRGALRAEWRDRATALGFDSKAVVSLAEIAAAKLPKDSPIRGVRKTMDLAQDAASRTVEWIGSKSSGLGEIAEGVIEHLKAIFTGGDPLVSATIDRLAMTPSQLRTEAAVASAIRILGQREAAFPIHDVSRTALNLGLKGVTIKGVEARVQQLADKGELVFGKSGRPDGTLTHVTTPEHIAQERSLLAGIDAGRGKGANIVPGNVAATQLQLKAGDQPLNGEQLAAATLALASRDRVIVVQGVAGAGKTTMISAMAEVMQGKGKHVVGLAQANKMVNMLRDETGVPAQTLSSFVNRHLRGALAGKGEAFKQSQGELQNTVLVLDEASLVANKQMNDLVTIANRLGVDRLVMIGDKAQLQPIDAGKAFALVQSHEPDMAVMSVSQRQRTEHMKAVASLSRVGHFAGAFAVLGERVVSAGNDFREAAARKWLELSAEDRERTAIYASGRESRSVLNLLIQDGLRAEGSLQGDGLTVHRLDNVNLTREELRYPEHYRHGQVLEVTNNSKPGGLARGTYNVVRVSEAGRVFLVDENGKGHSFRPDKLDAREKRDTINLSERESLQIHKGDKIVWTANDKERQIHNSEAARILSISPDGVEALTASGEKIFMAPGDKMLERLNLAYAINMHQAQGMTTDVGIGVMHSAERQLSNQRLTHVMATRVRDDITIFTNDAAQLLRSIESHLGDKASALEQTGEKGISPQQPAPAAEHSLPAGPSDTPTPAAATEAPKPATPTPIRDVPEKTIELSL